jgi:hypothetical protein
MAAGMDALHPQFLTRLRIDTRMRRTPPQCSKACTGAGSYDSIGWSRLTSAQV